MKEDDLAYYRRRVERERELAGEARHPNAVRAHARLAGYYAEMLKETAAEPSPERHQRLSAFSRSR